MSGAGDGGGLMTAALPDLHTFLHPRGPAVASFLIHILGAGGDNGRFFVCARS